VVISELMSLSTIQTDQNHQNYRLFENGIKSLIRRLRNKVYKNLIVSKIGMGKRTILLVFTKNSLLLGIIFIV